MTDGKGTLNHLASFLSAEGFKYEYLLQAPDEEKGVCDVEYAPKGVGKRGNMNYFVYNTEAHPPKVRAEKAV